MLRFDLPEPPDDAGDAIWIFDGLTGALIRELPVDASRVDLTVDDLVPEDEQQSRPFDDLTRSRPKTWKYVQDLTELEAPIDEAVRLLSVSPELPRALGEEPVFSFHRVVAWSRKELPASLEHARGGYEVFLPEHAVWIPRDGAEQPGDSVPFSDREGPAYRPGALPRLVTPRSRRAAEGKDPKLQKPDVDGEWDWRFKKFFLGFGGAGNGDGRPFAECTRRFLGPELTPGGIYWLVFRKDDASASLRELRARSFRKTRSMSEPHVAESDAWLVDRMLNGFHPVLFRRAGGDDALEVRFDWDGYDFTDVNREKHWGLAAHEGSKQQYELPNVRAALTRDGDALTLHTIEVTYRKGPRLRRASPDRPMEHEPAVVYTAGGPSWAYAKRLLRCQLALAYEMDQHLARGHLLVEQYLAALETTLPADHPLYGLLKPYLRSVDRINAFGDLLVMGETGAIRNASALSARAVEQRLLEQVSGLDWRGFRPRAPVVSGHRFARAAAIFWRAIETFVTEHVAATFTEAHWAGVEAFSKRLTERSPPYVPYLGDESIDWLDRSELASHGRAPGEPAMSRVSADPAQRTADLVALATHAIYHATFVHTWTNDRQFEDVGDPGYASFGLMSRRAPPLSGSPAEMEAWEREADPLIRDAGFQMTVARILTHMDWGHLMAPANKAEAKEPCMREDVERGSPVHPRLRELLCAERGALEALHDGDPFARRHERDRVDLKSFRSLINT